MTVFSDLAIANRSGSGAVGFFYLSTFNNFADLEAAIQRLMYIGKRTNTPAGLRVAHKTILEESAGDRPDVPNVVIVITDGKSNEDTDKLPTEAAKLKQEATVVSLGVTPAISIAE